jgi:hypothetical protein
MGELMRHSLGNGEQTATLNLKPQRLDSTLLDGWRGNSSAWLSSNRVVVKIPITPGPP